MMQSEWKSESLRLSHFFTTVLAFGHDDDWTNEIKKKRGKMDQSRLKGTLFFLLTDLVRYSDRRKFW